MSALPGYRSGYFLQHGAVRFGISVGDSLAEQYSQFYTGSAAYFVGTLPPMHGTASVSTGLANGGSGPPYGCAARPP